MRSPPPREWGARIETAGSLACQSFLEKEVSGRPIAELIDDSDPRERSMQLVSQALKSEDPSEITKLLQEAVDFDPLNIDAPRSNYAGARKVRRSPIFRSPSQLWASRQKSRHRSLRSRSGLTDRPRGQRQVRPLPGLTAEDDSI